MTTESVPQKIQDESPSAERDWTHLLKVLDDVRAFAVPLFRCRPEEIQIQIRTESLSLGDVILAEIWHVVGKSACCLDACNEESSRYFTVGPYSGQGDTVAEALLSLSYILRIRVEETIDELRKALPRLADAKDFDKQGTK